MPTLIVLFHCFPFLKTLQLLLLLMFKSCHTVNIDGINYGKSADKCKHIFVKHNYYLVIVKNKIEMQVNEPTLEGLFRTFIQLHY